MKHKESINNPIKNRGYNFGSPRWINECEKCSNCKDYDPEKSYCKLYGDDVCEDECCVDYEGSK